MEEAITKKSKIPLYIAMVIPFFTGFGGQVANVITILILIISLYYFNTDEFFLMTPIVCIYYSQLLVYGESLGGYNLFMWICVIRMIYKRYLPWKQIKALLGMWVLLIYSAFVMMMWQGIWNGINFAVISCGTIFVALEIRENDELKERFHTILVAMCLSAALYGIFFVNIKGIYVESGGLLNYIGRYCGTMSDPNYMAFFYCISATYIAFNQNIGLIKKYLLLVLFFLATALTGSLTALITILAVFVLYIFIGKEKKRLKKLIAIILFVLLGVFIYYALFTDSINLKIFTIFQKRLTERLGFASSGQYDMATSGRTEYSGEYLKYLFDQNVVRILFGGYQTNSMGLMGEAYNSIHFAAHNTYVDVLMTCGITGFTIFVMHFIFGIRDKWRTWRKQRSYASLSEMAVLIIGAIFIAGLSCFPSTSYLLFLML